MQGPDRGWIDSVIFSRKNLPTWRAITVSEWSWSVIAHALESLSQSFIEASEDPLTKNRAAYWRQCTSFPWPRREVRREPVSTSQIWSCECRQPTANRPPSWEAPRQCRAFPGPEDSARREWPSLTSQRRMVLSQEQEASRPSGRKATLDTQLVCPRRVRSHLPLAPSHICAQHHNQPTYNNVRLSRGGG